MVHPMQGVAPAAAAASGEGCTDGSLNTAAAAVPLATAGEACSSGGARAAVVTPQQQHKQRYSAAISAVRFESQT